MLTNNLGGRSPSAAHQEGLAAGVSAVFAAEVQTACATKQREGRAKDRTACREAFIGGEPCVFGMIAEGLGSTQVVDWVHVNALPTFVHFAGHDPSATSMLRAGQQTFAALHQEALKMVPETGRSGCTLTLCAINRTRSELTTINIGACAAVLFARDRVTRLTDDHRLQVNAQEQERLKASGILVSRAQDELGAPVGALRAWPGGLLCARALGRVGPAFVLPRPSCSSIVIPREFIRCDVLICSDGVWDELLVSAVHAIALSCPSATSAAQLVVSSAAAQHKSYDQRGYGQPRDDSSWYVDPHPPSSPVASRLHASHHPWHPYCFPSPPSPAPRRLARSPLDPHPLPLPPFTFPPCSPPSPLTTPRP